MKEAERRTAVPRWIKFAFWAAYALDWFGGVGGHLFFGGTPAGMSAAAPLFLLLASAIVVLAEPDDWRALLTSFLVGFAAEAIGVATGYPFGRYRYTAVLAPSILGVPPVMAGAWMILVAGVRQMRLPYWVGALILAGFDLVIDPLSANTLGFWRWQTPGPYYGIPLGNFAGWLAVSLLLMFLLRRVPPRSGETVALGISILLFFTLLGVAHGYFVPAALGALFCGAGYWRWRSSNVSTRI